MTGLSVPPPITQSVYFQADHDSPRSAQNKKVARPVRPSSYSRRQHRLGAELQTLLDAQAEALARGADESQPSTSFHSVNDDFRSGASSTSGYSEGPTSNSDNRLISLREARRGLYTTMRRLASVKSDEAEDVRAALKRDHIAYTRSKHWFDRQIMLNERIGAVKNCQDTQQAQRIRERAKEMQSDIDKLERQLSNMKHEQRRLYKEAEDVEGRVQVKLSAYRDQVDVVNRDVQDFLQTMTPEVDDPHSTMDNRGGRDDGDGIFWSLPPKRRTLDLAIDIIDKRKSRGEIAINQIEFDKEALLQGAIMWKEVVRELEDVEKTLRQDMANLSPGQEWAEKQMSKILGYMDNVMPKLQSQFRLAEAKGWNLLVAAIGAEIDTFQTGYVVLKNLVGIKEETPEHGLLFANDDNGNDKIVQSVIHIPQDRELVDMSALKTDNINHVMNDVEDDDPPSGLMNDDNEYYNERNDEHDDSHDDSHEELLFSRHNDS